MTVTASEAARSNGNGKSNGNGQHAEQSEAADETGEGPSLEQLDAYVRDHFFTPAELAADAEVKRIYLGADFRLD